MRDVQPSYLAAAMDEEATEADVEMRRRVSAPAVMQFSGHHELGHLTTVSLLSCCSHACILFLFL